MPIRNTTERWGWVSIGIHWLTLLMVLSLVVVPSFYLIMDDLSRLVSRFFARFIGEKEAEPDSPTPEALADMEGRQVKVALARGLLELGAGGVILWLAVVWGLVQSLKIRLLAMLHLGFLWLGLSFVLAGVSQLAGWGLGAAAGTLGMTWNLPWLLPLMSYN